MGGSRNFGDRILDGRWVFTLTQILKNSLQDLNFVKQNLFNLRKIEDIELLIWKMTKQIIG